MLHFEQNDVDAYKYGMEFARLLDFLKEKEKAAHARELYQKGWQFMSYLQKPEDTDIAVDYNPLISLPVAKLPLPKAKLLVNLPKGHSTPDSNKEPDNEPNEPEMVPVEHQKIEDAVTNPLPYEGNLIVKLPYQTYLMAAKGKPYLIEGSIGKAFTNGRIQFAYTNFVIIYDLKALRNKVEKYYVSPLISKGVIYNGEARYSSTDFITYIERIRKTS
ncbi:MAG: hypothetical protein IPP22_08095 [Nitrosomonas sp.]|nr:hypothetical protein [Nitrosomonas sp.]